MLPNRHLVDGPQFRNRDEWFGGTANKLREARDGQTGSERTGPPSPCSAPVREDHFLAGTIFLIRYVFTLSFAHCFMFSGVSGFSNPSSFVRFRE
jgi:hypothetical protein